jgi:high frequency lysogenization protein
MNIIEERTIALAGVLQAAELVQMLARTGQADASAMQASLQSVLVLDAVSTAAVFGGLDGVQNGLRLISDGILSTPDGDHIELLRYTMSLLHLQNQLMRNPEVFAQFGGEVESLTAVDGDQLAQSCSAIYQKYISKLQPQIIVQGEEDYLQRPEIPAQVRSLLLAGIRAAVLWQQKGGGKFRMMWERTRMRNAATALLGQITVH